MKTAVIVLCKEGILIWAIPPLSPQPPDLPDHFLATHIVHIPPLFKIPLPDGTVRRSDEIFKWMTPSSWYFGSWESLYFDILYTDSKLLRFKIIIKSDLGDASLHSIIKSEKSRMIPYLHTRIAKDTGFVRMPLSTPEMMVIRRGEHVLD